MSLSEQEQQTLREIEQSLLAEDPKFGSSVSGDDSFGSGTGVLTLRGVALVVVGLVMLVGGVALAQSSLWFVVLSIVGFLVMFGAGVWMLRGGKSGGLNVPRRPAGAKRSTTRRPAAGGGMTGKLEDNFRRRFEER